MSLYYITGVAGSGKSLTRSELVRRGYSAFDTDEDGLGYFYHNTIGEPVKNDLTSDERTPEWRENHTWKLARLTTERLAFDAKNKSVFLCGAVANDSDELWDLFTKVFALTIDEDVLRHRITGRTNNDFGKSPHEMENILRWQRTAKDDYGNLGAMIIDAAQPIGDVVDDILSHIDKT